MLCLGKHENLRRGIILGPNGATLFNLRVLINRDNNTRGSCQKPAAKREIYYVPTKRVRVPFLRSDGEY